MVDARPSRDGCHHQRGRDDAGRADPRRPLHPVRRSPRPRPGRAAGNPGRFGPGPCRPDRRGLPQAAGRGGCLHHLLQLPASERGRQAGSGPGNGQHLHHQAGSAGPAGRAATRRSGGRGRLSARRGEHPDDLRHGGLGRPRGVTGREHGQLHRVVGRRKADHGRRCRIDDPGADGAGRQGCAGHDRGRGRECCRRGDSQRVGLPQWTDLHGTHPGDLPHQPLRPAGVHAGVGGRDAEGGGCHPARHPRRSAGLGTPEGQRGGIHPRRGG